MKSYWYIAHHGVKGQHWGVRNGPPYPLERQSNRVVKGMSSDIGLKKKTKEYSESDDVLAVNPNFSRDATTLEWTQNCRNCTIAYDMRKRGYDVSARPYDQRYDANVGEANQLSKFYKNAKISGTGYDGANELSFVKKVAENQKKASIGANYKYAYEVMRDITKESKNQHGEICIYWNAFSGHSMFYEVKNGKMRFIDTQSGDVYNDAFKVLTYCAAVEHTRLDDKEPNYKMIKRWCVK